MDTTKWRDSWSPTRDETVIKCTKGVIAAYIIAIGLGVVGGFDVPALFSGVLNQMWVVYAGQGVVILCGLMLLCGFHRRLVAAGLALLILTASVAQNLVTVSLWANDAFAADLVLICALLACFWPSWQGENKDTVPVQHQATATPDMWPRPLKTVPRPVLRPATLTPQTGGKSNQGIVMSGKSTNFEEPDIIMNRLAGLTGVPLRQSGEPKSLYA